MTEKKKKLITDILDICFEIDWVAGIPLDTHTDGFVIGPKKYVEDSCEKVYGKDKFELLEKEEILEKAKQNEELATSDNVGSFQFIELTPDEYEEYLKTGELPENPKILNPKTILH